MGKGNFYIVISAIYLIGSLFSYNQSQAFENCDNPSKKPIFVTPPVIYLDEAARGDLETIQGNLRAALDLFSRYRWMRNIPAWGLYLDTSFRNIMGFVHHDLKDKIGRPLVVMNPENISRVDGIPDLAHELIHILHNGYRPYEKWWVKEGLAELGKALLLCSQDFDLVESYVEPKVSLTYEPNDVKAERHYLGHQYSLSGLFFHFLVKHCGQGGILYRQILRSRSRLTGVEFIDYILKVRPFVDMEKPAPFCGSFNEVFTQFQLARYMQNLSSPTEHLVPERKIPYLVYKSPQLLAPYSAIVYSLEDGTKNCSNNDLSFGENFCLQIRLE